MLLRRFLCKTFVPKTKAKKMRKSILKCAQIVQIVLECTYEWGENFSRCCEVPPRFR